MSIASELTDLSANRDAIKSAIEAKSPTVAPTNALSSFPAAIASISTGGGGWVKPADWPDIKALLEADTEDYPYKIYALYDETTNPNTSANLNNIVWGGEKAITSDGATYSPLPSSPHTWTDSETNRYGWVAFYSTTGFTRFAPGQPYNSPGANLLWVCGNQTPTAYSTFAYASLLQKIDFPTKITWAGGANQFAHAFENNFNLRELPVFDTTGVTGSSSTFSACSMIEEISEDLKLSNCQSIRNIFYYCTNLKRISDSLTTTGCTDFRNAFYACFLLESIPSVIDFSSATDMISVFSQCFCLRYLPDVINLSSIQSANSQNSAFSDLRSLQALPTHLTTNWSLSFASSNMVSRDSLAVFGDPNNPLTITGGMVYNLNTCPNASQTITLHANVKTNFTAEEQAAIETAMSNKNWTLSW